MPHNIASIRVLERLVVKKRALRKNVKKKSGEIFPFWR